jgi:hypothetical protein
MKRNVKKKKWLENNFFYTKLKNDKNLKVTHSPIKNITKSWPKKKKITKSSTKKEKSQNLVPKTHATK